MTDLVIDSNLTTDSNFTTPINIRSETFSTQELGEIILEAYKDIHKIRDILFQIYHDDINIKVILKERPSDKQLSKLIDRQLTIHKKFNYSFSFNFEYIPFDLYKRNDNDSSILKS